MNRVTIEDALIYVMEYSGFIVLLYAILKTFKNSENKNKFTIADFVVLLLIIVVAAIRYYVGADYESYYKLYNNITQFSIQQIWENNSVIAFNLLMYFTKKVIQFDYGIFLTTSVIIYPIIYIFMLKKSENPIQSLMLFFTLGFFNTTLNIIKQAIAMSIMLIATDNLNQKRIIRFVLLALLATLFHETAIIIAILLIIIKNIRPSQKMLLVSIIIGIILLLLFTYLPNILHYIPFIETEKSSVYFSNQNLGYNSTMLAKIGVAGYLIFNVIITYIIISNKEEIINQNKDNQLYINMLLVAIPFNIIALKQRYLIRITFYFTIILIVLLPTLFKQLKNRQSRKVYILLISCMIICLFLDGIFLYRDNPYFRYQTYLNILN